MQLKQSFILNIFCILYSNSKKKIGSGNWAIAVNGLLIHATLWMKLSEKSQTQKATCYMVPFIKNVQHRQIHVSGERVISLVLSRCSKTSKQQTSVTVWLQLSFIWQAKENTSSSCEGGPAQKKSGAQFWLLCLYALFPSPWACPA